MESKVKNYSIVREENWMSNACDCCEDYDIGIYFIYEDGEEMEFRNEFDDCYEARGFGTQEDALEFILKLNKINVEYKD